MEVGRLDEAVAELLIRSLEAWGVEGGAVRRDGEGALNATAPDLHLRVTRAPAELPFRWMLDDGARTRGVTSVSGLLRAVRQAIDPDYRAVRLRVAPLPPREARR